MSGVLEARHLSVDYGTRQPVHAVRDVTLSVAEGEFVGLVGESGCGKSTLAMALARLERPPARITEGSLSVLGKEWTSLSEEALRPERWVHVSIVLQSGMNALNPIMTVGAQFRDVMQHHTGLTAAETRIRSEVMMDMVEIDRRALGRYPHELSGGMKQRVAIALALVLRPDLVIMDEPTTALDVVVQRQILENLKRLRAEQDFAMLFVSHDLGLILELCDRVEVMYAGEIVESAPSQAMLAHPYHPYARALMRSLPDPSAPAGSFGGIPGTPPQLRVLPPGCLFAPRCDLKIPVCETDSPDLDRFGDLRLRCHVTREEAEHECPTGA